MTHLLPRLRARPALRDRCDRVGGRSAPRRDGADHRGVLARRATTAIVWVIVVAAAAAIIGDNIGYWLGRARRAHAARPLGLTRRYADGRCRRPSGSSSGTAARPSSSALRRDPPRHRRVARGLATCPGGGSSCGTPPAASSGRPASVLAYWPASGRRGDRSTASTASCVLALGVVGLFAHGAGATGDRGLTDGADCRDGERDEAHGGAPLLTPLVSDDPDAMVADTALTAQLLPIGAALAR